MRVPEMSQSRTRREKLAATEVVQKRSGELLGGTLSMSHNTSERLQLSVSRYFGVCPVVKVHIHIFETSLRRHERHKNL